MSSLSSSAAPPPGWLRERLTQPALAELRGRFHSHITVLAPPLTLRAFCAARPGLKATVIELADFAGQHQQQQDVMVTAYHFSPGGAAGMAHIADQLEQTVAALRAEGLEVVRVKLEHETQPTLEPFTASRYREIHIKLHLDGARHTEALAWLRAQAPRFGYVPSQNPAQRLPDGSLHQFLNLRIYQGTLAQAQETVDALCRFLRDEGGLTLVEVKQETAVLDTAHDRDRWWA